MSDEDDHPIPDMLREWIIEHYGIDVFNEFEQLYRNRHPMFGFVEDPAEWIESAFSWIDAGKKSWTSLFPYEWGAMSLKWRRYLEAL